MNFSEWLKKHDGQPCNPSKIKKLKRKETFNPGCRDLRNDLSNDYPGNIETHGDIGPYKLIK